MQIAFNDVTKQNVLINRRLRPRIEGSRVETTISSSLQLDIIVYYIVTTLLIYSDSSENYVKPFNILEYELIDEESHY